MATMTKFKNVADAKRAAREILVNQADCYDGDPQNLRPVDILMRDGDTLRVRLVDRRIKHTRVVGWLTHSMCVDRTDMPCIVG
jgi:hypothetical protein